MLCVDETCLERSWFITPFTAENIQEPRKLSRFPPKEGFWLLAQLIAQREIPVSLLNIVDWSAQATQVSPKQ